MNPRTCKTSLRTVLAAIALAAATGAAQAACIPWSAYSFTPNAATEAEVVASPLTRLKVEEEHDWRGRLRVTQPVVNWLQQSVAAGCQQVITLSAQGEIGRYVRDPEATAAGGRYRASSKISLDSAGQVSTIERWRSADKATSGPSRALLDHDHDYTLEPAFAANLLKGDTLFVSTKVTLAAGLQNVTEGGDRVVVSYEWTSQPVLVIYMPEPTAR